MHDVAKQPSAEMTKVTTAIDEAIGEFLKMRGGELPETQFEAPRHAWTLSNLVLRHTEALIHLAGHDVVLGPSAWVCARAGVETTARCLWLLAPDDEWQREGRWVTLLREGARLGQRGEIAWLHVMVKRSEKVGEFARAVESRLPAEVEVPRRTPSAKEAFAEMDPAFYSFYVVASQFAHGAEYATGVYRSNFGNQATYGDAASEADWIVPLHFGWNAFAQCFERVLEVSGRSDASRIEDLNRRVGQAIQHLGDTLAVDL